MIVISCSGSWVLIPAYVDESYRLRKWQDEEIYEISSKTMQAITSDEDNLLVSAPQRWRLHRQTSGQGPFGGWVVTLLLRDRHKSDVYTR